VSKRRVPADAESDDARSVAALTPEQRRKRRKTGSPGKKAGRFASASPWRRAAYVGVPVAVIIAVAVILVTLSNANAIPCLQLTGVPVSVTGTPAFPPHNTTNFGSTWCPGGDTTVLASFPWLSIAIEGTPVPIPTSIGRNSTYPGGVECQLPVATETPSSGYPSGTIYIESPWAFSYNLSTFFSVWAQSYATVYVDSGNTSQPIVYQTNDLLGFHTDSTHSVHLFVDGNPSSAGPSLPIDTLDYGPNPYPSCIGEKYGTGNTILLTYTSASEGAQLVPISGPLLATGPAVPGWDLLLFDSPMPHLGFGAAERTAFAGITLTGLGWLVGRHAL
jgi:hypothetical protein